MACCNQNNSCGCNSCGCNSCGCNSCDCANNAANMSCQDQLNNCRNQLQRANDVIQAIETLADNYLDCYTNSNSSRSNSCGCNSNRSNSCGCNSCGCNSNRSNSCGCNCGCNSTWGR